MKLKLRLLLAPLAGALALAATAARADDSATNERPPRREGPPPEMRAYHEKALKVYDANNDGKLDEDERAILREDVEAGKFPPPPFGGRGDRGPRGPHGQPPKEILEKYDTDKDGKLSDTERAALEADIKSGKLPPPPHRGPRGGRPPEGEPPAEPSNS